MTNLAAPERFLKLHHDVVLYWSLTQFYAQSDHWDRFCAIVAPLSRSEVKGSISIRKMDYAVTTWAREKHVVYLWRGRQVRLHEEYVNELKTHKKKRFDAFCRRGDSVRQCLSPKFVFQPRADRGAVETNIGQLNWFRFALERGVDFLVRANIDLITESLSRWQKNVFVTSGEPCKDTCATTKRAPLDSQRHNANILQGTTHSWPMTLTSSIKEQNQTPNLLY